MEGVKSLFQRRVFVVTVLSVLALHSAMHAQGGRTADHWLGTWATAVVARPQGPNGLGPLGRGAPPQAATPPLAPPSAAAQAPPDAAPPPSTTAAAPPNATSAPSTTAAAAPTQVPGRGAGRGGPGGRGGFVPTPITISNQTLRQIVHTTIGGERVRIVVSNAFGTAPLTIGAASIALRDKEAAITPGSARPLTFGGNATMAVPPGAVVVSDAANLSVPAFTDLAVDLFLPDDLTTPTSIITTHAGAQQTNYLSPTGNHVSAPDMPVMMKTQSWFFLARVEVATPEQVGAVVVFGDSITDGTLSTPDVNHRWPDQFARRLMAQNRKMAVLNEGIAGNRVLGDGAGVSALARFDRDVLVQTGVTHVIVLEGINDIGLARDNPSPSAADLIAAHKQLIERAHARGLKIFGATVTPFEGSFYWTSVGEAKRQAINDWIRTSKAYDGVVDFDAAVRDPASPTKIQQQYNPGDNLHMNDAGYQAMADAVDLALFKRK